MPEILTYQNISVILLFMALLKSLKATFYHNNKTMRLSKKALIQHSASSVEGEEYF